METFSLGERYTFQKDLGEGGFGRVVLAIDKFNKEKVAIKLTTKGKGLTPRMQNEREIMRKIHHNNVIKMISSIETPAFHGLVLEVGSCTLHDFVIRNFPLSEPILRIIMRGIFTALETLHRNNIIHHDIKPSNIVKMEDSCVFKLIDFNCAEDKTKMNYDQNCAGGTSRFLAPEILRHKKIGSKIDVWALGVTLYFCCTLMYPFKHPDQIKRYYRRVVRGKVLWKPLMPRASSPLRHLIYHMLDVNVESRFSITNCLQHAWFANDHITTNDTSIF